MLKTLIVLIALAFPSSVFAGGGQTSLAKACWDNRATNNIATLQGLECVFLAILDIIVPFAGLAAFVLLISGGFSYLTSGGDPKKLQQAQGIITGSIIGIIVIVSIYLIFLLLENLTGINFLRFEIPN